MAPTSSWVSWRSRIQSGSGSRSIAARMASISGSASSRRSSTSTGRRLRRKARILFLAIPQSQVCSARAPVEGLQAIERHEHRVLDHVLGQGAVAADPVVDELVERVEVVPEEALGGRLVAVEDAAAEQALGVGLGGRMQGSRSGGLVPRVWRALRPIRGKFPSLRRPGQGRSPSAGQSIRGGGPPALLDATKGRP